MHASPPAPPLCPAAHHDGGAADAPRCPTGTATPAAAVDSQDLLQGQKTVAIAHNGAIYRLQATRLGKLILTK
ncbi:hypothetical protein B2J88_32500 [Rhodococcus sp. SRB_17]|uniref:hemin uptake protein HemP n=1 Tax=Acidovorax sp. SRB_24 TaxID=1962700 RepID=UPI00145F642C|nr:hemin uptake protein HemP [Acidovorax sp. SRB_24]NMM79106.1 hypothetical protein [Acidovorax sp. SRB_24]NMM89014.1 hypothetical protein [Rhodococcus sp. SRB_17]